MTPKLQISECVINRLNQIQKKCLCCLYGIIYDTNILVLGFLSDNDHSTLNIQDSFPAEVDICGLLGIGETEYNSTRAKKLLQEVDVTDNPLFLSCKMGEGRELTASFIVHGKLEETNYEVLTETDIGLLFINVRLQTRLPFMCNFQPDLVKEASSSLRKQLASGQVAFHFPKTSVYLMGSDLETGLTGLSGDPAVGELCDYSASITEGCSFTRIKKKNVIEMEFLQVSMLKKATKDSNVEGSKYHAPIVDVNKRIYECLSMSIKIDALAMVFRSTKVIHLYEILIESLCRNLRLMERCLLQQLEKSAPDKVSLYLPEPFHFFIDNCGHFITRFYAKGQEENTLESERKTLHEQFILPMYRPYFKRTNAYLFKEEHDPHGPLMNPHESLNLSSNAILDSEISMVRGRYNYYHYMQSNFDDDGWGCAYRSLQTLFSWFRFQGYTEKRVPTHKEIQQCLVDIQDKPPNFVGSKHWIGSTEVSFCLDTMLGVSCRILHASSGEELGTQGPELVTHFKNQGTPVMIGGGVLAHTIIGVDYNHMTGHTKFLILDPHYTGSEDLHTITSKGWCGWKTLSFWNKAAYYNLCLPQVPRCI